jgi:hypothetical protein
MSIKGLLTPWVSMILGLVVAGVMAWVIRADSGRVTSELFPQNQDCQPQSIALHIRIPKPRSWRGTTTQISEPHTLAVTNCRRVGFQYLLKTLELTDRAYWLVPGGASEKHYMLDRNNERDLVVHVSHLQPATSILDPAISTNGYLLNFADRLQAARARFSGTRQRLADYRFDQFSPYQFTADSALWFLNREDAVPEFVGYCSTAEGFCDVLIYTDLDHFVFGLTIPRSELGQLDYIIDRTLTLIRSWKLQPQ